MEAFHARIAEKIPGTADAMRRSWAVYGNEAIQARYYLDEDLLNLQVGAPVLEIGAGVFALAGQLAREGFNVTALEPVGVGFDAISALGDLVLEALLEDGIGLTVRRHRAEEYDASAAFDFAYSINVLEHVDDVEEVLSRALNALRPGASLRFRCPNYAFPYEPHFGWVIPPNKSLARAIYSKRLPLAPVGDPQGLWASLNWVSTRSLRKWGARTNAGQLAFNPDATYEIWQRAKRDPQLMVRHSGAARVLLAADSVGLAGLLRWIPVSVQPVIDCRLVRLV